MKTVTRPGRQLTPRRPLLLALAAVFLAGCGDDGTGPEDRIVEGVNLTQLFAPATQDEVQTVLNDWSGRAVDASDVRVEKTLTRSLAGAPGSIRVVSMATGGQRHYGAVQVVDDAEPRSLPVLVFAHGGDGGTSVSEVDLVTAALPELADRFVLVAPAFRGEAFHAGSDTYTSDGQPSPWDRDVDDAFAFVQAAADLAPAADPSRVAVLGFSRGGGVALLMGSRDPGIDQVVEFFGPTDMFSDWVETLVASALRGTLVDLPGLSHLDEQVIQPLKRNEITMADARIELVRRSPVLFADRLPNTQLHHGTSDFVVPVSQGEALIAAMAELGREPPAFEGYLYSGGGHDPTSLDGALERTRDALLRLLP